MDRTEKIILGFIAAMFILSIPTWFDYGDPDMNWFIDEISRAVRNLLFPLAGVYIVTNQYLKAGLFIYFLYVAGDVAKIYMNAEDSYTRGDSMIVFYLQLLLFGFYLIHRGREWYKSHHSL